MPYLRDIGFVLQKEPFREHDRRYVLYGRETGLISAVSRGASHPASKQAGHLEPFTVAEVMIAKGAAFDKLCVAKTSRVLIRTPSLPAYAACGAVAEMALALIRPGVADAAIFEILIELAHVSGTLPMVVSPVRVQLVTSAAILKLLDVLGYAPSLSGIDASMNSADLSEKLVRFLRQAPLADVARVTASTEILRRTVERVAEACEAAHFTAPPKGSRMIVSWLG